jgi:hypothetical protein
MGIAPFVRAVYAAIPAATLALLLTGCGGSSSNGSSGPTPIPVVNPDPNNPLYGVGLENEAQNLDKIRAGAGKPQTPAKK